MSVELAPEEEDCFNFHWKIKNFSYCSESIRSPEFTYDGDLCSLAIDPEFMQCQLLNLDHVINFPRIKYQLSFLPCDGSEPLTADTMPLNASKEILFRTRRSSFLPDDTLTVHFQFSTDSESGSCLVQSQIGVKRKCFLWTIRNFLEDQRCKNYSEIHIENNDHYGIVDMRLKSIAGIDTDELYYIEISLARREGWYCVLDVSILDIDGKSENCVNGEFLFEPECTKQTWIFPSIIRKSKLLACKDRLMRDGTLSLKCNFAITMGTITEETAVLSYSDDATPLLDECEDLSKCFKDENSSDSDADLKSDLEKILDNKVFSDAKLVVCSQEINVHKSILGARSPVFEFMFTGATEEYNYNTFVIEDLDKDTLNSLILYIYTDAIRDSNWKNMKKLYSAAIKYEVRSLKQKCSSLLKSKFAISNICEALVLANSHEDADLETAALDFISKNDTEVFASRKWKDLEKNHFSLALRTLRQICLQKSLD